MAVANMILNIVTRGDMASLKAGIDMVVQFAGKVADAMQAVDAFADAHTRLSSDVSGVIERTKGLVSGIDAFTNANKLSTAGIQATREQLANLAVGATEYAQATGQDIPAAMAQMTQAIIAGSAEGLQRFGVDISSAKNKTEAQAMALEQLSQQFKDIEVEINSVSNMLASLSNNIEDATLRLVELSGASFGVVKPLTEINNALTQFNTMMEEAPNATAKFITSLKGLGSEMASVYAGLISNLLTPIESIIGVISYPIIALAEFAGMGNINPISALKKALEIAQTKLGEISSGVAGQYAYDKSLETAGKGATGETGVGTAFGDAVGSAWGSVVGSAAGAIKKKGGGKGGRGGGGGGLESEVDMVFDAADAEDFRRRDESAALGKDEGRYTGVGANVDQMAMDAQEELEASKYGPPTTDFEVQASMAAMDEWIESRGMQIDAEIGFAQAFGDSWEDATSRTSAGAMAAAGTQNLLRGAVTMAANAIVGSSKVTVFAVAEMVKGVALSVGIEATIQGLISLGHMIAAIASSWGMSPQVELHAAAVAQYAVTAAAAFAVAGASSAIGSASKGSSASSPTGTRTGQGQYGSPGYQSVGGDRDNGNVTIVLEGDAEGIFRVVRKENQRRSYSGSGSFAEQAA